MFAALLTLTLLASAPAASTPSPVPVPTAPRRVLVLDLEAIGVPAADADAATRIVSSAAAEVRSFTVFSSADLRRLAALEAERSAVGCDSETCLAEIAGALGAELVLHGSMSRLASTTTVALSLYEPATGLTERAFVEVTDFATLPRALRAKVASLLSGGGAAATPVEPPIVEGRGPSSVAVALTIAGGVLAVGGGVGVVVADMALDDAALPGSDKATLQWVGRGAVAVGAIGVIGLAAGTIMLIGGAE